MRTNKTSSFRYTFEEKLEVIKLYKKGYGSTTIGKKLCIARSIVKRLIIEQMCLKGGMILVTNSSGASLAKTGKARKAAV